MEEKRFYKVIIVSEFNDWVATYGNMTLKEAFRQYKIEDKGEHTFDKNSQYYVFGISELEDEYYPEVEESGL